MEKIFIIIIITINETCTLFIERKKVQSICQPRLQILYHNPTISDIGGRR